MDYSRVSELVEDVIKTQIMCKYETKTFDELFNIVVKDDNHLYIEQTDDFVKMSKLPYMKEKLLRLQAVIQCMFLEVSEEAGE